MFGFRKHKSDDQASDHGSEVATLPTGSDSNENQDIPQEEDNQSPPEGSPTESKGFFRGLFSKGQRKRDPLDPPPECFSRPLDLPQEQMPFPAFEISCNGRLLDAGWPVEYPGEVLIAHDIQESEWTRFLEDLSLTARLKPRDRIVSHVIPMTLGVGLYGILISNAIRRIMKRGKANGVASVVDIWNACYFQIRGVKVTLMRGEKILSGLEVDDDDSSQSSSDSSSHKGSDNNDESKKDSQEEQQKKEEDEEEEEEEEEDDKKRASPYYLLIEFQPIDPQHQSEVLLDQSTVDKS
ncbi:hypothetical protein K450DRAFT_226416 [Umbelopsis ramanniana AG]|uniref:Uncharacterized protein n=1 Tax=Umbelopsis ramanniana AG TaxID=1314678 RepID=A0AAD5EFT5_UMBRA|nr:uncharacterized protein K450DRAFT_226416 [Umbelopsis ramanniana AG]KAI8582684.1 hypothetical protein K450DRAFT_226416 [Umbelopsis ramanniana AG]